jgi:prevent-host-death family protein
MNSQLEQHLLVKYDYGNMTIVDLKKLRGRCMKRIVKAGVFKAECLKLMDEVKNTSIPIWITKHGEPIAKLVPIDENIPSLFGKMKGTLRIKKDIVRPIEEEWDANS